MYCICTCIVYEFSSIVHFTNLNQSLKRKINLRHVLVVNGCFPDAMFFSVVTPLTCHVVICPMCIRRSDVQTLGHALK